MQNAKKCKVTNAKCKEMQMQRNKKFQRNVNAKKQNAKKPNYNLKHHRPLRKLEF